MNDRRPLIAIALIIVIALVPMLVWKPTVPPPRTAADSVARVASLQGHAPVAAPPPALTIGAPPPVTAPTVPAAPERTVVVRSALYRYAISTVGARIVSSRLLRYVSMAEPDHKDTLELLGPDDALLGGRLIIGADTVRLDRVAYTTTTDSLTVTTAPVRLVFDGTAGAYHVELAYLFIPGDYRVRVDGVVSGLGPTGATLLVNLGDGFRDTEANAADNHAQSGIVTKTDRTNLLRFGQLKPLQTTALSGPFEWAAVKSKYFVAGLFAYDSTAQGVTGKIGGVLAAVPDTLHTPIRANVAASLSVPASGAFGWTLYLGPMEYDRLSHIGHDFDDVNPYGWSWIRWLVRPIAVGIRTLFVWMHHALGLGYGLVIVLFGLIVRVITWPLNRKSMRSMMAMQTIQPQITELQTRYKDDPARLNQEMIRIYKDNKVNPLSGCWPMLLPYPLLIAVFFVLAYTIEVRGVAFLWMPDLSRADPLYLIPLFLAGSQFVLSRLSQIGVPPNPQTKMMMYLMPAFMLVFFIRLASGLNLYYAALNIASLPQQWMVIKERQRAQAKVPPPAPSKKARP